MNRLFVQYGPFVIAILISVSVIPTFAQTEDSACSVTEDLICVESAKKFYEEGETVVISGNVKAVILDTPVSIQVFFGETLIQIDQVGVAQDGTYTATLHAEGAMWKKDGEYLIRAAYSGNIAETSFEFKASQTNLEISEIFEVDAGTSGTFDVPYTINGALLKNIQIKPEIFGLVVTIEAERAGVITLNLPRASIDSKQSDGADEDFIIFIDGSESPYTEEKDSATRKLTIRFTEEDTQIDIIGTFVVPEFGTIAALILAVAIISIIAVSARSRLSIMPKY